MKFPPESLIDIELIGPIIGDLKKLKIWVYKYSIIISKVLILIFCLFNKSILESQSKTAGIWTMLKYFVQN